MIVVIILLGAFVAVYIFAMVAGMTPLGDYIEKCLERKMFQEKPLPKVHRKIKVE